MKHIFMNLMVNTSEDRKAQIKRCSFMFVKTNKILFFFFSSDNRIELCEICLGLVSEGINQ